MMVTLRVRSIVWFATGVVLAVFAMILVTQSWTADAAPGDSDSSFVPIAPCRLFDTRPGEEPDTGKKTPLAAGEGNVFTQQVTGSVGNCTGIPGDATAVSMNVTIVNPTAQSNLRVFPANVTTPTASNLNWLPGQSPTPNKVDVKLSTDGKIKLFNFNGTVDVLADVVGYYTSSSLTEVAQRLTALETGQPFSVEAHDELEIVTAIPEAVVSLDVTAPAAGRIAVVSTSLIGEGDAGEGVTCSINNTGSTPPAFDFDYEQIWISPGAPVTSGQISGTRVFDVADGQLVRIKLVCVQIGPGTSGINDSTLTAIFTPAP